MKVITVPPGEKLLIELLEQAKDEELILQSEGGQWFVLTPIEQWQGFDVGSDEDFEEEVRRTSENQELLAHLRERRKAGPRISLEEVKRQLGLE